VKDFRYVATVTLPFLIDIYAMLCKYYIQYFLLIKFYVSCWFISET